MHLRRSTTIAALVALGASLLPATALAVTAAATTLYVDNTGTTACSNSGPGTAASPYCTIQAAADVAVAGQTVHIIGTYSENVTITRSGASGSPITFVGDNTNTATISSASTVSPALIVHGAHDVIVESLSIWGTNGSGAVAVDGSTRVTVDSDRISAGGGLGTAAVAVHVTGASTYVTVSRDQIDQSGGPGIQIDAGGSHDTVTTNDLYSQGNPAIAVAGSTASAVVSNTMRYSCNQAIAITGVSTGSSVENNVVQNVITASQNPNCPTTTNPIAGLLVDAAAAPGVTADYNIVYPNFSEAPYVWAGTAYADATALNTAVGQGAHDLNTSPQIDPNNYYSVPGEGSPVIDSANADAPGELTTDLYGSPRVDDPLTANTGSGKAAYYDRGAYEVQDQFSLGLTASATQAPVGGLITFTGTFGDTWSEPLGVSYDFGDGSPVVTGQSTVTHAFTATGRHIVNVTVTDTQGLTSTTSIWVTVVAAAPLVPKLTVYPLLRGAAESDASGTTDAWNITDYKWDFGDGTSGDTYGYPKAYHSYAKTGTYTVKVTVTDAGGNTATLSGIVTNNGSGYVSYGPVRLLDTRTGTGTGGVAAKVAPGKSVPIQIAGNGSIPTGVTAVALNVTVTDSSGTGFVTAYPDGSTPPNASNLNYTPGQTIPNAVIVPVGADGSIELYNGGATASAVDLIADVTGYFTPTATTGFTPLTPARILDTRDGTGTGGAAAKIPAGGTLALTINGADGGQLSDSAGITAVALNVTTTNTSGSGFITAYPDGTTLPNASNLNYTRGQTIANTVIVPVGADGKIDLYNGGATAGSVDLIADATGFFSVDSYSIYAPLAPTRLLDTRASGALGPNGVALLSPSGRDASVPINATAFVFNATVTQPTGTGFIAAYPDGTAAPNISNLNYVPGQTIANVVVAKPGGDGSVAFANGGASSGNVQLIVDVFGYFVNAS